MALPYEITRQFSYQEEKVLAKFSDEKDALTFMESKVEWDHKTKVVAIYRFYHFGEEKNKIDTSEHESVSRSSSESSSGRLATPSPLSTSAKPPGAVSYSPSEDDDL